MASPSSVFVVSVSVALLLSVLLLLLSAGQLANSKPQDTTSTTTSQQAIIRLPNSEQKSQANNNNNSGQPALVHIKATAIYISEAEFPLSRLLFRLTLKLALDAAERPLLASRVRLALKLRPASSCSQQYAAAVAAEEYFQHNSRLFIVSGCDEAIKSVSRLASQWQVPLMTAAGFSADLDDKSVHKSLIRVAFSLRAAVEFLLRILKTFKWRRVNLIVDQSDPNSFGLRQSIESNVAASQDLEARPELNVLLLNLANLAASSDLLGQPKQLNRSSTIDQNHNQNNDRWPNEATERAVAAVLQQSAAYSRVNILLIPQTHLRKFMLSAYDQNMATGLHTFISIPLLLAHNDEQLATASYGVATGGGGGGGDMYLWHSAASIRNSQARQAFESLMSIYLKIPSTKAYGYYRKNVTQLARTQYASAVAKLNQQATSAESQLQLASNRNNAKGSLQQAANKQQTFVSTNPYSAAFFDCIQMYASAVRESLGTLQAERNATQRRNLVQSFHANLSNLMRNRRYEDMLTGSIYINKNGDRESDYTLDDMNHMNGKYWPVILYRGETRQLERLSRIHWSSDSSSELPLTALDNL